MNAVDRTEETENMDEDSGSDEESCHSDCEMNVKMIPQSVDYDESNKNGLFGTKPSNEVLLVSCLYLIIRSNS